MTTLREGHRLGPYRIVRLLGQGGMGAVYEARQQPLERRVALKTLHPEFAQHEEALARLFNEAKVLSRLEHPSIVQSSDFGHAPDGTPYFVMDYLRGESLAHRLSTLDRRNQQLPVLVALQLAWQIADVLAVVHAQGIVHRDLKPENLMLVADPIAPGGERVKILDFGIAKLTRASDRGNVKTATQAVLGTPMYMSPEQCAGAGGVDGKSDVYSLGCVLYHTLAGRPPFVAEGVGELIGMHQFQAPPALSSLAPKVAKSIAELIHRLLTKDKTQRPSMSETADALGRLLSKFSGAVQIVRSSIPVSGRNLALSPEYTVADTLLNRQDSQRSAPASKRDWAAPKSAAGLVIFAAVVGIAAAYGLGSFAVRHADSKAAKISVTTPRSADPEPAQTSRVTAPASTGIVVPGQAPPPVPSPVLPAPLPPEGLPPPTLAPAHSPAAPATSHTQPSIRRSSAAHRAAKVSSRKNWDPVSP